MSSGPSEIEDAGSRHPGRRLDRRTFLAVAGLAVAGVWIVGCGGGGDATTTAAPPPPSAEEVERFTTVSAILAGVSPLPAGPAAGYLEGLTAAGLELPPTAFVDAAYSPGATPASMADLVASGATRLPGAEGCMRAIAAAWWSGIVPTADGGQQVVTFDDALVWRRVHEPSQCLGGVGSWSRPGEAA